ncbi:MAG: pyridoxal-phosphate dependent enzyme, partial [Myxococcota bacterium]
LGNVSALAWGLDLMHELGLIKTRPRICVAQAQKANPLYRAYRAGFENFAAITAGETEASAIRIGNPVSIRRAIRALQRFDGVVEEATESELAEASARADRSGAFTCPHTGVALAALEKLVAQKLVKRHHRVVVVSTASGLKFTEFKIRYHENSIAGVDSRTPNRPLELPNDYGDVRRAVLGSLP